MGLSEKDRALIEMQVNEIVDKAQRPQPVIKPAVSAPKTFVEAQKINAEKPPLYTFNEDKYIQEISEYVDYTYTGHYSGKYQATDMIIDSGHGEGFCVGSIMKYAKRYGKKEGFNRKDIMKIIHYGIILLHVHDKEHDE